MVTPSTTEQVAAAIVVPSGRCEFSVKPTNKAIWIVNHAMASASLHGSNRPRSKMGPCRESSTSWKGAANRSIADGTIAKKVSSKSMVKSKSSRHPETVGPNVPSTLVEHCIAIATDRSFVMRVTLGSPQWKRCVKLVPAHRSFVSALANILERFRSIDDDRPRNLGRPANCTGT